MIASIQVITASILIVLIIACGLITALVITCLIRASRYFMNAGKEQKLIRMELGLTFDRVCTETAKLIACRPVETE